jgi:peptide/nickel transport system permease protein
MGKYAARRSLIALVVLFIVSIVDFTFINLAPGDPLQAMLAPEAAANAGNLQASYEKAGLTGSLPVRYLRWLRQLARGNFGTSFRSNKPVTTMIREVLPATLILTITATLISLAIGVPLGVFSGLRERSFVDEISGFFSFFFTAIPGFFLAIIAVFFFAVRLAWLPATGMHAYDKPNDPVDLLKHLILPALVLGVLSIPGYVRYTRTAVLDVLREDYVRTARAKGLREGKIIRRHILPNALMPLVTVIGLHLPGLIGSSVLIEQVFAWPGMGQLSINSALFRDYPVFMGSALLYALAVLVSSTVTDLLYAVINPRIRLE